MQSPARSWGTGLSEFGCHPLICQRAWHGPEPVAEAALALVCHLIEEEARASSETGPRGPNGRA